MCFLCLWMKKVFKGKHSVDLEEVKPERSEAVKGIKTDEFKNCFEQQKKCLDRCTASNGEYFEGE